MNDDEAHFDDEESSDRWLPITGPLSPARAAVLTVALEQAGIEAVIVQAEEHVFPTPFGGPSMGGQQLAVREQQVVTAREVVSRASSAFPMEVAASAAAPVQILLDGPATRTLPGESPEERAAEAAFEAFRVQRYKQGMFIFVVGLIWTLAVLTFLRRDALLLIVGAVVLCMGLLRIYAALSLQREAPADSASGATGSDAEEDA